MVFDVKCKLIIFISNDLFKFLSPFKLIIFEVGGRAFLYLSKK